LGSRVILSSENEKKSSRPDLNENALLQDIDSGKCQIGLGKNVLIAELKQKQNEKK
jgi:hypothetical protein